MSAEATHKSMDQLPLDVLSLIASHLIIVKDLVSFRAVCRTWRSTVPFSIPSPPSQLTKSLMSFATITPRVPLLMYYGSDTCVRSFYNPICNTSYVLDTPKLAHTDIRCSKDGWLIMSSELEEGFFFFFFNPITNKRIDLPSMYNCKVISFSSVPTSQDCVVFCVTFSSSYGSQFRFIRRGQSEWTSFWISNGEREFDGSLSNPVFHNGIFYYMDRKGLLGTFDPTQESGEEGWTFIEKTKKPCNSIFRNYLVECKGELISVFMGRYGKWIKIFKLDESTLTWKKIECLGNNMLFLSNTASLSATASTGMDNIIFFPRFCAKKNGAGIFYSLKTSKFHTFGTTGYIGDDLHGTTLKLLCTWIDPNLDNIFDDDDDDDFQW